jgi:NADPH-dependent ferric siderophore reductase
MIRVTLAGPELADFVSASPDDHLKLILPVAGGEPAMRDYTPRYYDPARQQLFIDLVDHDGGPAADWARSVRKGDTIHIGGPRGSAVIEGAIDHWLLVGDETALPAIGRRIEELGQGASVTSLVCVPAAADQQTLSTKAAHSAHWVHRPLEQASIAAPLLEALSCIDVPENCFCWVAAEANVARSIRDALLRRGVPRNWIKASGYWTAGEADASIKSMGD